MRDSENAELRRRDGGWRGGGERRYKEGGRRIQEGIASAFAIAIAIANSHFAVRTSHFAPRISHLAFCTLHLPLIIIRIAPLVYSFSHTSHSMYQSHRLRGGEGGEGVEWLHLSCVVLVGIICFSSWRKW